MGYPSTLENEEDGFRKSAVSRGWGIHQHRKMKGKVSEKVVLAEDGGFINMGK